MASERVKSLWRYPVKSLMGERLDHFVIDARGVVGDRAYALSNSAGKFGSGKNTRRFRRIDGLATLAAQSAGDGVLIKFPDGMELTDKSPSINRKLTHTLGQTVTLTREAKIPHFDDGAIHILTTSSLSLLHALLPGSAVNPIRFRPNIVIDSQYHDQQLVGKTIQIGEAMLEITHTTERCRMVAMAQPGLESRPEILKAIASQFGLNLGVYAKVLSAGAVSVGDKVDIAR